MNRRVLHGAMVLAITLAAVGSLATSPETPPASESAEPAVTAAPAVTKGEAIFQPAVPVRSGRLDEAAESTTARPVVVRVAGIGLEAPIIPVGVDEANQFAVPAAATVGWYRYSSSPGESGASVLAAHVDFGGQQGAFFNLRDVLPGDTLEVELDDGRTLVYEVTGNTEYDKSELPAAELFRKDGSPVLQLITCGGTFDPAARSYEANIVVSAVPLAA